MSDLTENFKINLNQNLWGLLVCLGFVGAAEYYNLCVLLWLSVVPAIVMIVSVCITTYAYTRKYVSGKSE